MALRLASLARLLIWNNTTCVSINSRSSQARLISVTSFCRGTLIPYRLADIGEGIREVTVKEWFIKAGDKVSQFDNICEVQSDKASVTITSRYDGVVKAIHYKVDEICKVGSALIDIEIESEDDESQKRQISAEVKEPATTEKAESSDRSTDRLETSSQPEDKVLTTPAVRKIAKENNIDLTLVPASGRAGRVLKEDILQYLDSVASKIGQETSTTTTIETTSSATPPPVNKKYAKHMWKSMTQSLAIPHFVYSDECDVTQLVKLRAEVKEAFGRQDLKLSYMPFFIKAISRSLLQFPELNSVVDEKSESVNVKKEHNISFAMDTPGGLVVPNIKNVQDLTIIEITKELNRLQELGKKSSISPNDLTGGTFSISNIGIVGGTYTKPVILCPQVVIGAVGKIQKLPRFDEKDNIIAANILTVSWAADHRVVDGVTMAKFSNLWKHYVEHPLLLILGI